MPLRFSPARGAGSISINSFIRGPQGTPGVGLAVASQAEAEAGASNTVAMTPLRTSQALAALNLYASQAEAEAGTVSNRLMSPLRTAQAISKQVWLNVRHFGAVGDGVTNDTVACQAALTAALVAGGAMVYFPRGDYLVTGGLLVPSSIFGVRIVGAGRDATKIRVGSTDVTVLNLGGSNSSVEHLSIFGKGSNNDTGTFGATQHALILAGDAYNIRVWGGASAIHNSGGNDFVSFNVDAGNSYGAACITTTNLNWFSRCKFDHNTAATAPAEVPPYSARANSTAYIVGQVRTLSGYSMVVKTAGTSHTSAPTLQNYGIEIKEGTAPLYAESTLRWELLAPVNYAGVYLLAGSIENRFVQTDFTGAGFYYSVRMDAAGGFAEFTDCVMSANIVLEDGNEALIHGCTFGADISVGSNFERVLIANNISLGGCDITVAANTNHFLIANNILPDGTITVAAGTSNNYVIDNNVGVLTIIDGGTGTHKKVQKISLTAPAFSATKGGTDQNGVVDSTFTAVTWPTENYDIGGHFASNTWTPPTGKVSLSAQVSVTGTIAVGAIVAVSIYKNGLNYRQRTAYAQVADQAQAAITIEDFSNGTDAYTVRVFVDSTGDSTVAGVATGTFFSGHVFS